MPVEATAVHGELRPEVEEESKPGIRMRSIAYGTTRTFRAYIHRGGASGYTNAELVVTVKGFNPRSEHQGETELEAVRSAMEHLLPVGAKLGKVQETTRGLT